MAELLHFLEEDIQRSRVVKVEDEHVVTVADDYLGWNTPLLPPSR
jgi:hypothetical protein